MVEGLFVRNGIAPPTLTLGSNGAIKQAVRAGLGISLQARAAVELELRLGLFTAVPLRGLPARHWYALTSAAGRPRPVVEAFLDFIASDVAKATIADAFR